MWCILFSSWKNWSIEWLHNWLNSHEVHTAGTQVHEFESMPYFLHLSADSFSWPIVRSLVGCCLWGHTESDTLKWLSSSSSSIVQIGLPCGSAVKNLPAMQETWVWSLGWKDPLEKEVATHCSILAWEIQWTEEPGGLQSMGLQKSWTRP